jgi:putative ABC transport system permease protein
VRVFEVFRFAIGGIVTNRLRSALTTLGILIGVGAVILLVAVGNGSAKQIQANIERLGTNTLTVFGGSRFGFGAARGTGLSSQNQDLTVAVAAALADSKGAPHVKSVSPEVTTQETATYEGASHDISQFVGTYPSYFEASNSPVARGTYFTNSDVLNARKVVVIGQAVAEDLFGDTNPIGKRITVGGVLFRVVGVLQGKGSSGFQDANDIAIAPLTAVQQSLTGYGALSQILVQATSADSVDVAQTEITAILNRELGVTSSLNAPYQILNQSQLLSASTSTTRTFTVLLGVVAGLSLLVGGIGITNIMLVAVTERTREIGIRKAVGAPRGAILGQFLIEATLLSLFGGVLGVLAGIVGSHFTIVGVKPVIAPASIALAFGVSVAIGLFFGSYPASRAASLVPVEALRYE